MFTTVRKLRGYTHVVLGRNRMTIYRRIPNIPGRRTLGKGVIHIFHGVFGSYVKTVGSARDGGRGFRSTVLGGVLF